MSRNKNRRWEEQEQDQEPETEFSSSGTNLHVERPVWKAEVGINHQTVDVSSLSPLSPIA